MYVDKLSNTQIKNLDLLLNEFVKAGITNKNFLTAIASLVHKESGIMPQSEVDYSNTANSWIRQVFRGYQSIQNLTDDQLTKLKKNPEAFFNLLYGGRYGNSPTEGYKYRGRGYNGHTFKSQYIALSKKFGIDYVNNPDLLNLPENAAKGTLWYFTDNNRFFKPNEVIDLNDALKKVYRHNAGWGTGNPTTAQKGFKLMVNSAPEFEQYVDSFLKKNSGNIQDQQPGDLETIYVQAGQDPRKKLFQQLLLLLLLGGALWYVNKKRKQTSNR